MGIDELKSDENAIRRFCASRGFGAEACDYLISRAVDRCRAFDSLRKTGQINSRFAGITDIQLEQWMSEMDDGPTLFD